MVPGVALPVESDGALDEDEVLPGDVDWVGEAAGAGVTCSAGGDPGGGGASVGGAVSSEQAAVSASETARAARVKGLRRSSITCSPFDSQPHAFRGNTPAAYALAARPPLRLAAAVTSCPSLILSTPPVTTDAIRKPTFRWPACLATAGEREGHNCYEVPSRNNAVPCTDVVRERCTTPQSSASAVPPITKRPSKPAI